MRRFFLVLISITTFICLFSCKGNNQSSNEVQIEDTLWNDKVQDTFYGVKLGEPSYKIINALETNGFFIDKDISTESELHFQKNNPRYFTFGGFVWTYLDVIINNKKFVGIAFWSPYKERNSALDSYNTLVRTLSNKYQLTNVEYKDSTTFGLKAIYGRNKTLGLITCNEYESVGHEKWIQAALLYTLIQHKDSVSSEL